jgi:ketopantoate reductase
MGIKIIIESQTLDEKDDRCTRIAKRKYDVWPSAYASGAVVKCRQGKIWKDLKEEDLIAMVEEEIEEAKKKAGTESSKESSLHDWFGRKGAKGKSSGWVDCNTCRKDKKTGKKTCKSCGRKEGAWCMW